MGLKYPKSGQAFCQLWFRERLSVTFSVNTLLSFQTRCVIGHKVWRVSCKEMNRNATSRFLAGGREVTQRWMQAEGILLKNFWARIFSRASCSYPHKFYAHDASINCAKQEEIILFLTPCTAQWFRFLHPLLCNEESVVQKNFPENEKKVWVRAKKARKTSFSAPPKGPRFSRTRDTRVTGDKA